jgi:two-component system, NarL family, sensor histidine kinase UhpB
MLPNPTTPSSSTDVRGAALALPVFHKIWLATLGAVLVTASLAGLTFAHTALSSPAQTAGAVAVAATGALIVHAVLVRLALQPIGLLTRTAERVAAGEDARAPSTALADPQVRRLTEVFNGALDHVAQERERLRALAARAREMHEADRVRTARELHENTAQLLTTLQLRLQVARRSADPAQRDAALDAMRKDIALAGEAVRQMAFQLRPPAIAEMGAGVALATYARQVCEPAGVEFSSDLASAARGLSVEVQTALYRIAREAVDNAIRHGAAESVTVSSRIDPPWLEVTVTDDGAGFSVPQVIDHAECLGIFEMEQRAERVGGHVTLRSAPGQGTSVRIQLPREAAGHR